MNRQALPPDQLDAMLDLYARYMQEAKERLAYCRERLHALSPGTPTRQAVFDAEGCALQFRICCEITALASLSLLDPVNAKHGLEKAWNADQIMKKLKHLSRHPFPIGVSLSGAPDRLQISSRGDQMNASEMLAAYHFCGALLHRGTLSSHKASTALHYDLARLATHRDRLESLLIFHCILDNKSGLGFLCEFGPATEKVATSMISAGSTA